jgi:hypothetical protein
MKSAAALRCSLFLLADLSAREPHAGGSAFAGDPLASTPSAGPCPGGFWPMIGQKTRSIGAVRRDALIRDPRAVLPPSRFRAINFVFGHLRPGERNVLHDLSPIL